MSPLSVDSDEIEMPNFHEEDSPVSESRGSSIELNKAYSSEELENKLATPSVSQKMGSANTKEISKEKLLEKAPKKDSPIPKNEPVSPEANEHEPQGSWWEHNFGVHGLRELVEQAGESAHIFSMGSHCAVHMFHAQHIAIDMSVHSGT